MIGRRGILLSGLATMAVGCMPHPQAGGFFAYTSANQIDRRFRRKRVPFDQDVAPGTIVVDTAQHYLYLVEDSGSATRYGVGVGEEGRTLKGAATIGRKAVWPPWTPTANMIKRKPALAQYSAGVPGGPQNPLGARALYLYRDGNDTMFRLHGTNEPWTIGHSVSSGCIRLANDDIIHLYDSVPLGTTVLIF